MARRELKEKAAERRHLRERDPAETADEARARRRMVERQIASRGVTDRYVLDAMARVPRHRFVPEPMRAFAYHDAPLPIGEEQTISQPFIVALMVEALRVRPGDRVLDVGCGSGYAAAVMAEIADEVIGVERHPSLVKDATERLGKYGYDNVRVHLRNGSIGMPEHAPYDAIAVAAGAPDIAEELVDQLAPGGRMIVPVGSTPRDQELLLITKDESGEVSRTSLGGVRFVPLVGKQAWPEHPPAANNATKTRRPARSEPSAADVARLVREACEPADSADALDIARIAERAAEADVVLIGEATHGTSEFYETRAAITRALIEHHGFTIVGWEADWPDASLVDRRVRGREGPAPRERAFSRFPTWMWRNEETARFVEWLQTHNAGADEASRVSVHGLDLYSLHASIAAVLDYLDSVDPAAAEVARERYACFSPWEADPATYGRAVSTGAMDSCEAEAVRVLSDMMRRRVDELEPDGDSLLDAERNAALVKNAEQYYRSLYRGNSSWNLRDTHMHDTLERVMEHRGRGAKAVVWAHNSHVGDAAATEMGARGEVNIGHLARQARNSGAYLIGFGTDRGTVMAASNWGGKHTAMSVKPSHERSVERVCKDTRQPAFALPLRAASPTVREELRKPRLERAIGVIYRPQTELESHYFQTRLADQFDEYIWIEQTHAIKPLVDDPGHGPMETFPFEV